MDKSYNELREHKAYKYAKDITEGKILAGKYVIKECERFLEMIDNNNSRLYKTYFVDIKTVRFINTVVSLTNFATGEFAGQPCYDYIAGFQWYILINLYCVKYRNNPAKRRFEKACVFISRKNAKTWLVSMFMLLALLLEPDYAQLVAAANTRDQAKILFNEIKKTLEVSPKLSKQFKILSNNITNTLNNNFLFPIAAEARTTDGMLVSVGCVDEYGAARDTSIYDSLQTSMLSTINRLLFTISTGYPYPKNPMRDQIEYGKKVLDNLVEDDKFFLMCYELDEGDEWTDEKVWIKSNPLQAVSKLGMEFLRGECKMAIELPSKQMSFRTKNLNQWLDGDNSEIYIPIDNVKKCKLEEGYNWYGRDVYIGVDLSQTTDNTAISMVTYDYDLNKFVAKSWAFIPYDRIFNKTNTEKIDYNYFIEKSWCYACGGDVIDHNFVEEFLINLQNVYGVNILNIGYDRYNCISSANRWYKSGLDVTEIKQHSSILHPATKFLKELVLKGEFLYEENTLLEINFSNAKLVLDTNLNGYINKKKSNGKIDMVASLINAMVFWEKDFAGETNIYENENERDGFIIL